jgi:hypothetical protein
MEYVDAPECDDGDDPLVEGAVQTHIGVPGPSCAPEPVSGGRVILYTL